MASRADNALQAKLFALLTASSDLQTALGGAGRIKDLGGVVDSQSPPLVVIGEISLSDFGASNTSGFEGDITIHVWTQANKGKKDNLTILNRVYEALHNVDLALSGFPTVSFRCEFQEIVVDPDNRTMHGIQRYRVILGGN